MVVKYLSFVYKIWAIKYQSCHTAHVTDLFEHIAFIFALNIVIYYMLLK